MLRLEMIDKSYKTCKQPTLKGITISFRTSEFVSILGPSGSGKTTLLNIIGGLDRYDNGNLIIDGQSTKSFSNQNWDSYRNAHIGFIFQNYNLINHLTVLENVEMAMIISGTNYLQKRKKAIEILTQVGLKNHLYKKPYQLSGGQMQRVAIARALINDPKIILADEPTGALDSKSSKQIMDIIANLATDKLVIMVTHNQQLAHTYSNRIISLEDGKIIKDSNPYYMSESNKKINLKKTSMNFLVSLNLSFKNIITKKSRTILTAIASSIGIVGLALILALSNGMEKQINALEKDTLSSLPIIIEKETFITNSFFDEPTNSLPKYSDTPQIYSHNIEENTNFHINNINEEYISYINKLDDSLYEGITYKKDIQINTIIKNDIVETINLNNYFLSLPDNEKYLSSMFDILTGKLATKKDELLLIVDSQNRVDERLLQMLGINKNKVQFKDIMNKEIAIVTNDEYYEPIDNYFQIKTNLDEVYNNSMKAKIVGILRCKEEKQIYAESISGLLYTNELIDYLYNTNKSSAIVKFQSQVNYNVLTKKALSKNDNILSTLGGTTIPNAIYIYPKDFESKEKITVYLKKYNKSKIIHTDQSTIITTLFTTIINTITSILIAFSCISLIVSSIMIGIITYISVLERTKEIGILRSLGARKKDIKRVFKAETFIIGLTSGIIGTIITIIILIPINVILYNLIGLKNIATLNSSHAFVLILISTLLTMFGGTIPANIAGKKSPIEALKSE